MLFSVDADAAAATAVDSDADGDAAVPRKRQRAVQAPACASSTPLHYAASTGQGSLVTLLLESRASACATDVDGCTPLHNAAEAGHDTVCALLLEAGASASAIARHGQAAFHLAAERGHTSTARLLLDAVGDDDAAAQQRFAQLRAAPVARPDALQWRSYSVVPPGSTVAAAQKAPSQAPHAGAVAARVAASALPKVPCETLERLRRIHCTRVAEPGECADLIEAAEAHAARVGGWDARGHHEAHATADLVVAAAPTLLRWLEVRLTRRIWPALAAQFGVAAHSLWLQDAFVVRYEAHSACDRLPLHADGSELSFNLLLSDAAHFGGGGTLFEGVVAEGDGTGVAEAGGRAAVLSPRQGEMLSHWGKLRHVRGPPRTRVPAHVFYRGARLVGRAQAAQPVRSGRRYVLVGFVRATARALVEAHALANAVELERQMAKPEDKHEDGGAW